MIAHGLNLSVEAVGNTLALLEEGCTIPFISRYRKERTGALDEVQIAAINDENERLKEIAKRKETVTKTITDHNIFQCHRSFVVNLNNITSAQGNSNGYQLKLGTCPTIVPVSRTYVPKLKSFIA